MTANLGSGRRAWFWSAFGVCSIGVGLTIPFLGFYLHVILGYSSLDTGLLLGLLALANFSVALTAGRVVDRFGSKLSLLTGVGLDTVGYLGLAQSSSHHLVIVWLSVIGAGNGTFNASLSVIIRDMSAPEEYRKMFAIKNFIFNIGLGAGAFIGSDLSQAHTMSAFVRIFRLTALSYLILLLCTVVVVSVGGRPVRVEVSASEKRNTMDSRLLMLLLTVSLMMIVGFSQVESAVPLLLLDTLRETSSRVGVFVAVNTFIVALAQMPVLRLCRRFRIDNLPVAVSAFWVVGAAVALLGDVDHNQFVALLVFAAFFSIGECIFGMSMPAILLAIAPEGRVGRYSARYAAGFTGSGTVGNVVAVLAVGYLSYASYWLCMLAALVGLSVVTVSLRRSLMPSRGSASLALPGGGAKTPLRY